MNKSGQKMDEKLNKNRPKLSFKSIQKWAQTIQKIVLKWFKN